MKRYLLPHEGQFYKANLHSHTTCTDGSLSPKELKEVYKSMGYSVLAYTDHNIMVPHQDLADEAFLPLNGYEIDVDEIEYSEERLMEVAYKGKSCHLCLIALESDNLKQVCFHRVKYLTNGNTWQNKDYVQFYEEEPDYVRYYTPECINEIIRRGREHGFFVTYNHPTWSLENYEQYSKYENMNAMEICNYSSFHAGYDEYNPRVYDDMLRDGKRIYCIGADDNHNGQSASDWDSGGAWVMIKAEKLQYRTITKALENGHFYASQGPEIYELWVEDGRLYVITSDAERIQFNFGTRHVDSCLAKEGQYINTASTELNPFHVYVRVTVQDHRGRHANSNAYFIEDILGK